MKTELTREESQHLIDLGVPKEKASCLKLTCDSIDELEAPLKETRYFNITDFLNGEILPKEILIPHKAYALTIEWAGCVKKWRVYYDEIECGCHLAGNFAVELIDAFYQVACWYYGEYLKSERK